MGIKYGVKYGSNSKNVGYTDNSSITASLGSTSHTLSTTKVTTLSCTDKVCTANLVLNGTTAMSCKDKMMGDNILIITVVSEASTYAVFTASGTFIVPAGVTTITITCVGGGGGSGGNPYAYLSSEDYDLPNGPGGGGGGGYVVTKTSVAVTPGESLTVVVGAGGARGTWSGGYAGNGGESYVARSSTKLCRALGGARGMRVSSYQDPDHPFEDSYGNSIGGYGGSGGGAPYATGSSGTAYGTHGGQNSTDGNTGSFGRVSSDVLKGRGQGNLTYSGDSNGKSIVQPDGTAYAQNTYKYNDATSGVLYGGGGGGGYYTGGLGGDGGGGTGCRSDGGGGGTGGTDGTTNTGGGGGGCMGFNYAASLFASHAGGSGVVIIKFS